MREDSQFSPGMLLDAVNGHGLTMGLVVDLTKTDRFYDKADLVSRGVGHYKLRCEGLGVMQCRALLMYRLSCMKVW
jgi:hypothetical protein